MKPTLLCMAALVLVNGLAAAPADSPTPLQDKTLVVWVSPANLTQRGGSVLTIEKPGGAFDGIVLGELAPAKCRWMSAASRLPGHRAISERSGATSANRSGWST